jgi:hypothetical protein
MKSPTLYRIHLRDSRCYVGPGFYHWVIGHRKAGQYTIEAAREMIAHILTVTDEPDDFRRDVKVTPVTGGFKSRHKFLTTTTP